MAHKMSLSMVSRVSAGRTIPSPTLRDTQNCALPSANSKSSAQESSSVELLVRADLLLRTMKL